MPRMNDVDPYLNVANRLSQQPPARVCGTCFYHQHEYIDDGWVCVNDASDRCTDWTDYDDTCDEWEGRN